MRGSGFTEHMQIEEKGEPEGFQALNYTNASKSFSAVWSKTRTSELIARIANGRFKQSRKADHAAAPLSAVGRGKAMRKRVTGVVGGSIHTDGGCTQ